MRLSLFFYTYRKESAIFLSATNVCTTMCKFISSQFFANRLIAKDLLLENVDVIGDGNCETDSLCGRCRGNHGGNGWTGRYTPRGK